MLCVICKLLSLDTEMYQFVKTLIRGWGFLMSWALVRKKVINVPCATTGQLGGKPNLHINAY